MPNELLAAAVAAWVVAGLIALTGKGRLVVRTLLVLGCAAALVVIVTTLPSATPVVGLPTSLGDGPVSFTLTPEALWLLGFGLLPAGFACALATPVRTGEYGWLFGVAASLIGALGVFGLREGTAFLIAWEVMSFGGAVMILREHLAPNGGGRPVLFMLGLLEVGVVALILAILLLGVPGGTLAFDAFPGAAAGLSRPIQIAIGILVVVGFGAKLGLLPFYEWVPGAYGSASGATGTLLSSVVLNAAFFGLSRALLEWLPPSTPVLGELVVAVGTLSAILAILYAFQQEDWRALLSFSSAENASIAVMALGTAMIFRADGETTLASLAWVVALLHLAGHSLAKGALFLSADGVYRSSGSYAIAHTDLLRHAAWPFGLGALFAAMSLAAMPPQAGFVSEWYVFQTIFQGFRLSNLGDRLTLAVAGAGLALTAAVAFATFVKVFGIGLLGSTSRPAARVPAGSWVAVGALGSATLLLAVGMPFWLPSLDMAVAHVFGTQTVNDMHVALVLVPATGAPISPEKTFAFISPSMLVIAMPLLALLPLAILYFTHRLPVRRAAVWYGGSMHDPDRAATTALTFSNALRTFYAFIYRPTLETTRETNGGVYFINRLVFNHDVAPVFGPYLFAPAVRLVRFLADKLSRLQSGHLNFYLALIGLLLVLVLALVLL